MRQLILRLLLVLTVALASVHSAIGRAEARGATDIVLCADGGLVTLSLNAEGQPVAKRHGCPDCVMGGLALAGLPPALPSALALRASRTLPIRAPLAPARPALVPVARGPPDAV